MALFHRCKPRRRSYPLFLFVFVASLIARASVGGSISGTVQDASGSVVPGATVTVREESTGLTAATHTDGKGHFAIPVLPVGRYELGVEAPGFRGYRRKDIGLDTDAALTLDVRLTSATPLRL